MKLVVLSEGLTGRIHELKGDKTTIGRVEDNTFQIPEPSVSSHHCEIFLRDKEVVLKDLNSTNGTFVSGQQLEGEAVLKPGQIFRLGQVEIRLETDEAKPILSEKKLQGQTRTMPRGVSLDEFSQGSRPVSFDKNSPFAKKSNKGTILFIAGFVVIFLIIAGIIAYFILQSGHLQPPSQ
ncbi:MAG: FHA domain-containing protein [Verrucomicrobiota bacterium]|nr:FHA domain-containing protein [Verrucomicrobiota bacterium]